MRSAGKIKPGFDVSPVTIDVARFFQLGLVKPLLVPLLVFVLKICVDVWLRYLNDILLVNLVVHQSPPEKVPPYFLDQLVGDLETQLKLLNFVYAVLERDGDHTQQN